MGNFHQHFWHQSRTAFAQIILLLLMADRIWQKSKNIWPFKQYLKYKLSSKISVQLLVKYILKFRAKRKGEKMFMKLRSGRQDWQLSNLHVRHHLRQRRRQSLAGVDVVNPFISSSTPQSNKLECFSFASLFSLV